MFKWLLRLIIFALVAYVIFAFSSGGFTANISKQIIIKAPPAKVWQALVDLDNYGKWNPAIEPVKGTFVAGQTIELRMKSKADDKGILLTPQVLTVDEPKQLRWQGQLFVPYLFDATHEFTLTETAEGETLLVQSESFSGFLIPATRANVLKDTENQIELMNAALQKYVEAGNTPKSEFR